MIINALATKKVGMTRTEILKATKMSDNGKLTEFLENLEYCGFIRKYNSIGMKNLQFGMGDIDEYVQKCNQHEHPMGTDTGGSFQTVGLGLQEITSLGYRVLYVL